MPESSDQILLLTGLVLTGMAICYTGYRLQQFLTQRKDIKEQEARRILY